MQKLRDLLIRHLSPILLGLIVIQPALDVLSYFAGHYGLTSVTTLLRFGLLAAVALLGFILTRRKRVYLILGAVMAVFWAAHMLNCFRIGYASPVLDAANLLRLMNFPLYALTFITALEGRPKLRGTFYLGVLIAFIEIIVFTALPWLMGRPVYTYEALELGVLGWFLIPSAQSAVIVLTAPIALFAAYRSGKYPVYLMGVALPAALMFLTGTKLNYFSIFLVSGAYIFLFAIQLGKRSARYVLPLLGVMVLSAAFKSWSPMAARDALTASSQGVYSGMISSSLDTSGADQATLDIIRRESGLPSSERQLEKVRRTVLPIYSDTGIYGYRTAELNARFGLYNVMEAFGYTDSPEVLSNTRKVKLNYSRLVWQEKDLLTRLLGFEYSEFILGGTIYDPENDFPGVFYNMGYLGFAIYLWFIGFFVYRILRALAAGVRQETEGRPARLWPRGAYRGLKSFITLETGAMGICFLLALGAAQISGNVLRRPNVTIYFAIAAACLYSLTAPGPRRRGKKEV